MPFFCVPVPFYLLGETMLNNYKVLHNLGSLYFWLAAEETKEGDWIDWLIGNEILHTRLNLQRIVHERNTDS